MDSPTWSVTGKSRRTFSNLGADMFHHYITKHFLIFIATYIHISYLDTLSSHHVCQIEASPRTEFKTSSKFYSPGIKAKVFLFSR